MSVLIQYKDISVTVRSTNGKFTHNSFQQDSTVPNFSGDFISSMRFRACITINSTEALTESEIINHLTIEVCYCLHNITGYFVLLNEGVP